MSVHFIVAKSLNHVTVLVKKFEKISLPYDVSEKLWLNGKLQFLSNCSIM